MKSCASFFVRRRQTVIRRQTNFTDFSFKLHKRTNIFLLKLLYILYNSSMRFPETLILTSQKIQTGEADRVRQTRSYTRSANRPVLPLAIPRSTSRRFPNECQAEPSTSPISESRQDSAFCHTGRIFFSFLLFHFNFHRSRFQTDSTYLYLHLSCSSFLSSNNSQRQTVERFPFSTLERSE